MPIKILFVCMGNICRSPAAEGVMNSLLKTQKLNDKIICDSAGTIGYHVGEKADHRMRQYALKRGYNLTSRSRKFNSDTDFEAFDYIITMDQANYSDIMSLDTFSQYARKVHNMVAFCQYHDVDAIPDPYYGGSEGFDLILNLLEDACQGLLNKVRDEHQT